MKDKNAYLPLGSLFQRARFFYPNFSAALEQAFGNREIEEMEGIERGRIPSYQHRVILPQTLFGKPFDIKTYSSPPIVLAKVVSPEEWVGPYVQRTPLPLQIYSESLLQLLDQYYQSVFPQAAIQNPHQKVFGEQNEYADLRKTIGDALSLSKASIPRDQFRRSVNRISDYLVSITYDPLNPMQKMDNASPYVIYISPEEPVFEKFSNIKPAIMDDQPAVLGRLCSNLKILPQHIPAVLGEIRHRLNLPPAHMEVPESEEKPRRYVKLDTILRRLDYEMAARKTMHSTTWKKIVDAGQSEQIMFHGAAIPSRAFRVHQKSIYVQEEFVEQVSQICFKDKFTLSWLLPADFLKFQGGIPVAEGGTPDATKPKKGPAR